MTFFKRTFIATALSISMLVPLVSFAEITTDTQALIASLQAQIASLQAQIKSLRAQPSAQACYTFNTNLKIGDAGKEIVSLYYTLQHDGFALSKTEGGQDIFDEELASAVVGFQEKYKDEILTPNGLKYGTGYAGKSTRAKLNQLYGCGGGGGGGGGSTGNLPPVISGVSGPTSLNVGEQGTWTVSAHDPENGALNYSVVWGDEQYIATTPGSAMPYSFKTSQTATFTHSYSNSGNYTPVFYVSDNTNQQAKTSISVNVGGATTNQKIQVLYPNGGETFTRGNSASITWSMPPQYTLDATSNGSILPTQPRYVNIYLNFYYPPCTGNICPAYAYRMPYTIATNIPASSGKNLYNWTVGKVLDADMAKDGSYYIQVCQAGEKEVCDQSDSYFKIVSGQTSPSISIFSPSGSETFKSPGDIINVKWSTQNIASGAYLDLIRLRNMDVGGEYYLTYNTLNDGNESVTIPTVPAGTYTLEIKSSIKGYTDAAVGSSSKFTIVAANVPTISVLAPNGGESFVAGQGSMHITYKSSGIVGLPLTVYLYSPIYNNIRTFSVVASSAGTIDMDLAKGGADPVGQYKINVCAETIDSPSVPGKPLCDSSDNYFNIVGSSSPTPPQPVSYPCSNNGVIGNNQFVGCVWKWQNTNANDPVSVTSGTSAGDAPAGPYVGLPVPTTATALSFDWPYPSEPPINAYAGHDYYTAQWRGNFTFEPGTYHFVVGADDGVKVRVNGVTKVDQWYRGQYHEGSFDMTFTTRQSVSIDIDYFEEIWTGMVKFGWASVSPQPIAKADLIPTSIIVSPTGDANAGNHLVFHSGVQNTGGTDTGVMNVKWFLDDVQVGYGSHQGIPAGSTITTGNAGWDWWSATPGSHTIKFSVDTDNFVDEGNENNNTTSITVNVLSVATTSTSQTTSTSLSASVYDSIKAALNGIQNIINQMR